MQSIVVVGGQRVTARARVCVQMFALNFTSKGRNPTDHRPSSCTSLRHFQLHDKMRCTNSTHNSVGGSRLARGLCRAPFQGKNSRFTPGLPPGKMSLRGGEGGLEAKLSPNTPSTTTFVVILV